jgi:hypothetical protein
MKLLLFVLLLNFLVLPQSKPKKSDLRIIYDKIEDRTNISTKPKAIKNTSLVLLLYFNHKGPQLTEPVPTVAIMFDSYSRNWQYLKDYDRTLFVLADDQRFQLDNPSRDSNIESNPGYRSYSVSVHERLIFPLDKTKLETIANATKVEMKLGPNTFSLGDDTLKSFRELLDATVPATP